MSNVKLVAITKPLIDGVNTADEFIAYTARVSNPSNQMNTLTASKLIKYCIKNKHWSVFEQVFLTVEITTTRDIGRQILRHRSFTFQEFSQRYGDPTQGLGFEVREARLQDTKNRQNSIDTSDTELQERWKNNQEQITQIAQLYYEDAIKWGIAKEQARAILPEGLTQTRMYMSGSRRSFIHWIDIRTDVSTQKEHRQVALAARNEILKHFPSLEEYWFSQEFPKCKKEPVDVRDYVKGLDEKKLSFSQELMKIWWPF
jgi:thymidylate synthase (FAD)